MTKVLHITTVSESLTFLRGQLAFFREQGMRVWVVSRPDIGLDEFARQERAQAIGVEMERQISPVADLKSVWQLVREIRRVRPDIVHAHTPKGGLLGMIAAKIAQVPVAIYHIRGLPYMEMSGNKRRLMMATERVAAFLADKVFCVSHSIASVAVADGLVPENRIKVFLHGSGNGVDSQGRFNPAIFSRGQRDEKRRELGLEPDDIVVLFVGRLAKDKGIRELAAAWELITAVYPDARLILVGAPDERDPIPGTLLKQLEDDPTVVLVGNQQDTAPYYNAADLVVLPTYREGFPNVLLEAGAMALPSVATRVPGCTDAVEENRTGILVPPKDADALGAAIVELASNPDKRIEYGRAARTRVEKYFDSRKIWAAIYDEYRILLDR